MNIADIRRVPHPGQTLRQRLKTAGLSAAALSRRLNVPTNRVTSIMNGQRSISGDTALRLAHFFQTPPDYWLGLQAEYELFQAIKEKGHEITALPTIQSQGNETNNGWKQL